MTENKYYLAVSDRGPSGPCGQSVETTRSHNDLFVFEGRKAAVIAREQMLSPKSGRAGVKILGIYSEEMGNLIIVNLNE